jgi:hypothetical protein
MGSPRKSRNTYHNIMEEAQTFRSCLGVNAITVGSGSFTKHECMSIACHVAFGSIDPRTDTVTRANLILVSAAQVHL